MCLPRGSADRFSMQASADRPLLTAQQGLRVAGGYHTNAEYHEKGDYQVRFAFSHP